MKSTTIHRGGLLFINLFFLDPKGCKLMNINTSFRIRGQERNFFTSFLNKKILPDNSIFQYCLIKSTKLTVIIKIYQDYVIKPKLSIRSLRTNALVGLTPI
jgi:hypothetical protein